MDNKTKRCPYCGEEILSVAKKCKHCGQWLIKECPHCHNWIKATARKCKYCKQWIDEYRETEYEEDEQQNSIFRNILQFCGGCFTSCLSEILGIVSFCVGAHILLPSEANHINKIKTTIAENMDSQFAARGAEWGELVNINGYYLLYGPNFEQDVITMLDERYSFKIYDLIVISFCDMIAKENEEEETTVSIAGFGIIIPLVKTITYQQ